MKEDVELRIGGKLRRFEKVEHARCEACGERIFGLEASRQLDVALPRRRAPTPGRSQGRGAVASPAPRALRRR